MEYSVTISQIIKEFNLEVLYLPEDGENYKIYSTDINRPSLLLSAGFTDFFDNRRIQICGKVEMAYIDTLTPERRAEVIDLLFSLNPSAVVVSRGLAIYPEMMDAAAKYSIPFLRTYETTSNFTSAAISYLNVELAPRTSMHGVLVEIYGEGVLITGESGIGKSETAMELIKRGHTLVADDSVDLRRVSNKTIVGSAPANIAHYIELRGLGIINVRRVFGITAVKATEQISLVVHLERWREGISYSVIGDEELAEDILGLKVPCVTIPVSPGRNLAVIIEVAAMTHHMKKLGYNPAGDILEKLGLN